MRHRKKKLKLNKERDHSSLLLCNLATSIILYEKVKTTSAKAKRVKPMVDALITQAKTKDKLNAIREINRTVLDPNAGKKLLEVLKERYKDRNGGYTRTIKLGHRSGDAAPMVLIQLV